MLRLARHGGTWIGRIGLVSTATSSPLQTVDNPSGIDRRVFESRRAGWWRDYPR